jgi:hypothetical protein
MRGGFVNGIITEKALVVATVASPTAERHDPDVGPAVRFAGAEQPHPHYGRLKEALREPDVECE